MKIDAKLMLLFLFTLCCPFWLVAQSGGKSDITLVANGKSNYVIVVPDKDLGNKVGKAAKLLQSVLSESTGCKLPIVKESTAPPDKSYIYLGKTKAAEKAGIPFDKLKDWTFCKRVIGKNIFLAGNDASANIKGPLSYHDREYLMQIDDMRLNKDIRNRSYKGFMGTYKAVSSFLEKQLGVRFLLPGQNGLHVPKHKTLKISGSTDFTGSARFPFCYGRSCYGDITIPLNHNEIPYFRNYGGHSFISAVPKKIYKNTHPEYFVMINGKRQPEYGPGGNHLCISNPEVQELMMKELERQYDAGFKWVELGATDGGICCQCEKCKALSKYDYGDALWIVFRKIAEQMKKRRPDMKVVCVAYYYTRNPPKSFNKFPDNVIIEMTSWDDWSGTFAKWKHIKIPKMAYIYNWGEYHNTLFCPKRSLQYLARQLRSFDKNDVIGILKCHMGEALGLDGPAYYVYGQLLFDPYADPEKIADDFYRAAYGKAYKPMKQFFTAIYSNLDYTDGSSRVDVLRRVKCKDPNIEISYLFPSHFVVYLGRVLDGALRMDKDPKVQARLKLVKRELDYLKNLIEIYACNDAYNMTHSPEAFKLLDTAVRKRDKMLDSWYDANRKMKQEPGFNWPFFLNLPKKVIRDGGGQVPSPFPGLLKRVETLRKSIKERAPVDSSKLDSSCKKAAVESKSNAPMNYEDMRKSVLALQKQKRYTEALTTVDKMQKLFVDVHFHDIALLKLQILRTLRKYAEMTTAFSEEELEQLKGAHGTTCRLLVGIAYENLGQYNKAVSQYEKASKLLKNGPHAGIVRLMKAECENYKLKDHAAALKSYQAAVDTAVFSESAKTKALYEIARIQFEAKNEPAAQAAIDQIIKLKNPNAKWKNMALQLKKKYLK